MNGRYGHARTVVVTVIEEELAAAKELLNATQEVAGGQGFWAQPGAPARTPSFVVTRIQRSNTPAALAVRDLLEAWRPEIVLLAGIAGGVGRWEPRPTTPKWVGPLLGDVVIGHFIHYADYAKNVGNQRRMRYFALDHPSSPLVETLRDSLQGSTTWQQRMTCKHPRRLRTPPKVLDGEILATESVAGSPKSEAQRYMLGHFDNVVAVDMESAGIARSIHDYRRDVNYNPRWIAVRGISDRVWAAPKKGKDTWSEKTNAQEREQFRIYAAQSAAAAAAAIIDRLDGRQTGLSAPSGRVAP